MNNKMRIVGIKTVLTLLILATGILIKTLIGMLIGHNLLVAWLGNALILFPTLSGAYYVWTKYPFSKKGSEVPNYEINDNLNDPLPPRDNSTSSSNEALVENRSKTTSLQTVESMIATIKELEKSGVLTTIEADEKIRVIRKKEAEKKQKEQEELERHRALETERLEKIKQKEEFEKNKKALLSLLDQGVLTLAEYNSKLYKISNMEPDPVEAELEEFMLKYNSQEEE